MRHSHLPPQSAAPAAPRCPLGLVSKGIDADRIRTVGDGDEKPIAPNDTAEGRQKNRRIEAIAMQFRADANP